MMMERCTWEHGTLRESRLTYDIHLHCGIYLKSVGSRSGGIGRKMGNSKTNEGDK